LRAKLGLPNAPVILSVARLSAQKRLANLIEAIREVQTGTSPPVLVLVGDGPDRPELERLARECIPGRAIFTGYQADPISWLAAADVFALPSACEGLPGALIEAMAAGLPCVATDIPGNRDLIRHEITGLLVPVDSTDGLASAITRVLSDRDLAERLARSGQDLVFAEFDEGREFQAWDALFTELAVASQRDAPRGRPMSRAD
jgi:glycosyltransferase involved in cell wall biosynthesis